eukprot:TRINITY_DN2470_c0_g1_i1.p1 TRINITY_DN2470_c0_g1~~TRINITY_DN2470_c0_g1_i1.p1  ORF type:complete len:205 (-),score=62.56 TRINITY_DN2470_c0_g1_i1:57-671(-)
MEEEIVLSDETQKALLEFLQEKQLRNEQDSNALVTEDWGLSQFWYTNETADHLSNEALRFLDSSPQKKIACVCTPSIFISLKRLNSSCDFYLFDFDHRFEVHGEKFIHYDYQHPENLPKSLKGQFDYAFFDPPFLSEECQTKVAVAVKYLCKDKDTPVVAVTGIVMKDLLFRLFPKMRVCKFQPEHTGLKNDFFCCSNYEGGML